MKTRFSRLTLLFASVLTFGYARAADPVRLNEPSAKRTNIERTLDRALDRELSFPLLAKGDMTGKVHVSFVIDKEGKIEVIASNSNNEQLKAYVLRKLGRRVMLLDGIGGSIHEQSHPAGPEDALVAISFRNYYPDTARLFPELVARGVPAISITDSLLSPIVEGARVVFEIQDMPEPALRTLVAPMCLVQALAIGLDLAADFLRGGNITVIVHADIVAIVCEA